MPERIGDMPETGDGPDAAALATAPAGPTAPARAAAARAHVVSAGARAHVQLGSGSSEGAETEVPSTDEATRAAHRAELQRRAIRHSRRVRRMRWLVPALGGAMALALAVLAALPALLPFAGLEGVNITAEGLVMNNPRLSGHLGDDRRYDVEARRAVQSILDPTELRLEDISARLEMGADDWVDISGARAFYDVDTEILQLSGGVRIASSDGTSAHLRTASVFLKEGRVESPEAIEIDSRHGAIRAGSIDVVESGDVVRMSGGVSIRIDPAAGRRETAPDGADPARPE